VHQIELEMQNDMLREALAELLESNSRYTDLYDFAPVGYLTIDEKSIILEANLTLARQLETERGSLIGRLFPNFIAPDEKRVFRSHLAGIFKNQARQSLEARLIAQGNGGEFPALLELMFVETAQGRKQCRISVIDISERRKAEEAVKVYMEKLERSNRELYFQHVSASARQERLRGNGHGTCHLPKNRRASSREHHSQEQTGTGRHIHHHPSGNTALGRLTVSIHTRLSSDR
jgi:PAS domain S-box-containing protein